MIGESRPGDNLRRKLIRDLLTSSLPANVIARSAATKQSSSPPNRASHWIASMRSQYRNSGTTAWFQLTVLLARSCVIATAARPSNSTQISSLSGQTTGGATQNGRAARGERD